MSLEPEKVAEREAEQLGPGSAGAIGERIRELAAASEAAADAEPAGPEHPRQDEHTETCPACDGWGTTATGSRKEGQEFHDCSSCSGRGWRELIAPPPPPAVLVPPPAERPPAAEPAQAAGQWGWGR